MKKGYIISWLKGFALLSLIIIVVIGFLYITNTFPIVANILGWSIIVGFFLFMSFLIGMWIFPPKDIDNKDEPNFDNEDDDDDDYWHLKER